MNLPELFATWQAWNERNVVEQAARRADTVGDTATAEQLRAGLEDDEPAPTAVEALAAQHQLAELMGSWRWQTVTAAREQGASWDDVAAATGTDPTSARESFRAQLDRAEQAAVAAGIPFGDAERYRAAAKDDTNHPPVTQDAGGEESDTMSTDDDTRGSDDDRVEHISGPTSFEDGLVEGEIALPGGLPPDDDEAGARWDEAFEIAQRDGYVMFDPATPGGFRSLTPDEHIQLTDAVRASEPLELTAADGIADDEGDGQLGEPAGKSMDRPQPCDAAWWQTDAGQERIGQWARETADPAKAVDDSHPDDLDRLQQRLDELRVQLTGYTWREGVDRDEALADRREQLGTWYIDDAQADGSDEDAGDGAGR